MDYRKIPSGTPESEYPKEWVVLQANLDDEDGFMYSAEPKKSRGVDVRGVTVRERLLVRSANGTPSACGYYHKHQWRAERNSLISDIKETKHEAIADLLRKEQK